MISILNVSLVARKPVFGFQTKSNTNQPAQIQEMARGLKFRILKEERLYYLCRKTKDADQLCSYRTVDLRFVLACAKSRISQDTAHMLE